MTGDRLRAAVRVFGGGMIATLCCVSLYGQGFSSSSWGDRMFSSLDRNRNGTVEPDEVRQTSERMQDFLQRSGVNTSRPISREEMQRASSRMMESFRSQQGGGGSSSGSSDEDRRRRYGESQRSRGGDRDDDDDDDDDRGRDRDDDDDRDRGDDSRSRDDDRRDGERSSTQNARYTPRPRVRVTVDLPDTFHDGDSDGDGQVGLYEWTKWKGPAVAEFARLDRNGDGFLTPRELHWAEEHPELLAPVGNVAESGSDSSPQTEPARVTAVPLTSVSQDARLERPVPTPPPEDDAPKDDPPKDNEVAQQARRYFGEMDRDRNGQLSLEEWGISRRIKPMFERAGIDLSEPMAEDQFVTHYVRVSDSRQR